LEERKLGLIQFKIYPFNKNEPYYIKFDESDYSAYVGDNPESSSTQVRFIFNSLKTPKSVYDFDTLTKKKDLKKKTEILGGFDSKNYDSQRIFAKAKDGVEIPLSLVYRKDKFKPHQNPLFLAGYGAYGINYNPSFDPDIISLLDRGFVYAIAHVRGGSELGRQWYLDGKLLHKKNTFTDFITVAKHLEKKGYAAPNKMYATGASAGGLLIGAVMNMAPSLFKGIIAEVPFVDLINTMMDPNIPLTTAEYAEWGNPHEKIYYDYMLSYSPYDNVKRTSYPHLLVKTSYHDSQVQYWEPAKWVAKLRDMKTDDHLLIFQTLMNASHSGVSGRYESYKQTAFDYAFLLSLEAQN
jgi:oligopeptidase B